MIKGSEEETYVKTVEVGVIVSWRTVIRKICSSKWLRLRACRSCRDAGEGAGAAVGVAEVDLDASLEGTGEVETSGATAMLL